MSPRRLPSGNEAGEEEEEPPQPAFSYFAGHTPDQLYGNAASTNFPATTPSPGDSTSVPSGGSREDWVPPLHSGGYAKGGLPRHTFSDVGQHNPGFNAKDYPPVGNSQYTSTGNTTHNPGIYDPDHRDHYAITARGHARNSNYPGEPIGVEQNMDRRTGLYEGLTDQGMGTDIRLNDMNHSASGPVGNSYASRGLPSESQKRFPSARGMRPTTKQSHIGTLPPATMSEYSRNSEPAKYSCLCIFAIVLAVVVALGAGFAAGWFIHSLDSSGEWREYYTPCMPKHRC